MNGEEIPSRLGSVPGMCDIATFYRRLTLVIICGTNHGEMVAERIGRRLAQAGQCPIASGFAGYPSGAQSASDLINMATWRCQEATPFGLTSSNRGLPKTVR